MNAAKKALLEKRDGWDVGRDPRQLPHKDLLAAWHKPMSPLKALRAPCIDCKAGELSEVRRCAHLDCPAWPYRMGTNPWQAPLSLEVLEARRRGGRKRAAQFAEPSARRNPRPEQDFQVRVNGETWR